MEMTFTINTSWQAKSNSEFKDLCRKYEKWNVPIATPVFDGAKEKDVTNMLEN